MIFLPRRGFARLNFGKRRFVMSHLFRVSSNG